jgi:hypothetical protein
MNKVSMLAKLCCACVLLALSLNAMPVGFGQTDKAREVDDPWCMPIPECLFPGNR